MENPVADKMVTAACASCQNIIDVTGLEPGDGITCPYCNHEFTLTRQFGNFLLEKQLGAGGMGAVYLGQDTTLNRVVAVKVLRPELVSDQKFMSTFLREAEITASLNHPNIVQVYAFGQHEEVYYMVVEYISGGSLDDRIMNLGRITELEGIEIGIAVARGLECALQRGGLIHRDIKPGNILFNANNTPKVVDFGLSLSFETTDHFDGEIWGTPYYVAPEKLERQPEDFRSDLYSLGATLFHAISGRPPYEGEDPNDVAMKHLSGNVVSLKAFVPDISDQMSYAVSKAMARYPEDRYESYAAFIEQLEDAKRRITDPNFHAKQHEDVLVLGTANTAKFRTWMMLGLAAIVVLVAGLLIWKGSSFFQQKETVPSALNAYAPTADTTAAGGVSSSTSSGAVSNPGGMAATPNLALGKPFVSSDPNVHGANAGLTDGSHPFATGPSPTFPKTVTVDLLAAQPVNKVLMAVIGVNTPRTVEVSLSADGTAFQPVGQFVFAQAQPARHVFSFPAQTARYVRITYLDHYETGSGKLNPNVVTTRRVEVYGP
jgi:serine/threonine protein kinase